MNRKLINTLLNQLDSTVNSNSFWLEFDVPDSDFAVEKVLLQHLKTGNFHHQLTVADIERGWYHYSEMVILQTKKNPY